MAGTDPGLPGPPTPGGPATSSAPRHAARGSSWRLVVLRVALAAVLLAGVGVGTFAAVDRLPETAVQVGGEAAGPPTAQPAAPPTADGPPYQYPGTTSAATSAPATSAPVPNDPGPAGTTPTPRPTGVQTLAGPTPAPPAAPGGSSRGTGLVGNALYRLALDREGVCRARIVRPDPPLPDRQLQPYLTTVVACIGDALRPSLKRVGITLSDPVVVGYRSRISTPCGWLDPSSAPAYYCSGDATIYLPLGGDDGDEAYTLARVGYLALIAHEYGHHLQESSGIFDAYTTRWFKAGPDARDVLTRRLELQADCFAGVLLAHVGDSIDLTDRDRAELRRWHSFTGDEDSGRRPDHGSSAAQVRWLERGLDSADYGRCQTWSVPVRSVT